LPDLVDPFDDSDDDTSPKNTWIHQVLTAEEQSKRQLQRLFERKNKDIEGRVVVLGGSQLECLVFKLQKERESGYEKDGN
jgi:hypothetical protein